MDDRVLEQYRAVREATGLQDLSDRGKIEVVGPDRISFLQAMLSNEVQNLNPGEGRYGTLLTATGKIVADFYYYRFPEFVLIDVSGELTEKLLDSLNRYVIMDEVELLDVSELHAHFSLQGPASGQLLSRIFGSELPREDLCWRGVRYEDEDLWVIRRESLSDEGFELILPSSHRDALRRTLEREGSPLGLQEIGDEAADLLRLERGRPAFGRDMTEKNNPLEAGISSAYSLTKGCYPGQEVVAKATNIGGVARRLARLRLEGRQVPGDGAPVCSSDGKEIGRVTSAAFSPALDCVIALALLKRNFTEPGLRHEVETPEGRTAGEVVESFGS